jgi:LCP family protein required for cell wall assembly
MDTNNRNKRPQSSLDGFVSARPSHNRHDLRALDQYYQVRKHNQPEANSTRVDSFRAPDGFTPMEQPEVARPGTHNAETEVTRAFESDHNHHKRETPQHDALSHKRKRRFSLRRKKQEALHAKKSSKLKIGLRAGGVMAALLILVGGGLALRTFLASRNIFKGGGNSAILNNTNVDPTLLKGEGDGRVNILMLGKGGAEQKSGPDLTDTIIIASIDPIAKEASLLSIPRDLWVKSPSGYQSKINEVYADAKYAVLNNYSSKQRGSTEALDKAEKAGLDAIKKTVSDSMGVPIHYYTMIDFTGFRKAIDTVGGIKIDVEEPLIDPSMAWENGGRATLAEAGIQNFDGKKALMYARSRKGSSGGDFDRAERQRQVILALKDKVLSTGTLANPIKLNQLIGDFGTNVSTDFSTNEILRIYDLMKEISGDKVVSVSLSDYVKGDTINNLSVQVPNAGLFNFSEIQNYVRNIMRDAFLKSEEAKIIILNGTDTKGLATQKSKELKSYGYNILSVGDAPTKTYTDTILVDLTDGKKKYTLSYLQKRLGVTATNSLPDSTINSAGADFVIIIGTNDKSLAELE